MNETLRQMERVKQVRAMQERMSEATLAVAAAGLHAVEKELRVAQTVREEIAAEGAEMWSREAKAMSSGLRRAFGMDCERYEQERLRRLGSVQEAESALRLRRIDSERSAVICAEARAVAMQEAERRAQAETVDRFLARSRWSSAKIRVRTLSEAA
ncbi:MAG: hypothetical protein ABI142_05975 [Bryocella sp.]